MIGPIININGSSSEELERQYRAVGDAARTLFAALKDATPHPRDYQTHAAAERYKSERDAHQLKYEEVSDIIDWADARLAAVIDQSGN